MLCAGSAASIWLSVRLQLLAAALITALGLLSASVRLGLPPGPGPAGPLARDAAWAWLQRLGVPLWGGATGLGAEAAGGAAGASLAGLCLAYTLPVVGLLQVGALALSRVTAHLGACPT